MRFYQIAGGEHGPPQGRRAFTMLAALMLLVGAVTTAKANTIAVTFVTSDTFGNFTYKVSIASAGTYPDSTTVSGSTTFDSTGTDKFDNFTIYDFDGFSTLVSNTTGFTFTNPVPGVSDYGARNTNTAYPDSATVNNLVFKNKTPGGVTVPFGGDALLGFVVVKSIYQSTASGYFSSKDSDGGIAASYGDGDLLVAGPGTPAAVPMPASAACVPLLLGLLGLRKLRPARLC